MERLTEYTAKGFPIVKESLGGGYHMAETKLAAFEDIGLTTTEAKEAAELFKAKQEGRLVIIPDGNQNIVYAVAPLNCEDQDCPRSNENGDCDYECPLKVHEFNLEKLPAMDALRVEFYATREEAEAELRRREDI